MEWALVFGLMVVAVFASIIGWFMVFKNTKPSRHAPQWPPKRSHVPPRPLPPYPSGRTAGPSKAASSSSAPKANHGGDDNFSFAGQSTPMRARESESIFHGHGGSFGGAGASGSWDPLPKYRDDSDSCRSSSSSSSDSSSSSSSSSCDSGSSGGGSTD